MNCRHVRVDHYGSIVYVTPLHAPAQDWLSENTTPQQWAGPGGVSLVVEPRYLDDLLTGLDEAMHEEGL